MVRRISVRRRKTLIPNDFRDFLAIASITGLLGTFMLFVFGNPLISERMDAIFLIISGAGLLVAGKVLNIREYLKDGLEPNEITMVLSVILGISASVIGVLLLSNVDLPATVTSIGGYIALASAIFIFFDYVAKNS